MVRLDGPAAGREAFPAVTPVAVTAVAVVPAEVIRAAAEVMAVEVMVAAATAAVAATGIVDRPSHSNEWSPPSVGGLFFAPRPAAQA